MFALPLPGGRLCSTASVFGAPRSGGARLHEGIDLCNGDTRTVVAPASGRITRAGKGSPDCGLNVAMDHGNGITSSQCHLAQVAVRVGQTVAMGDPLGIEGETGNAEGIHLHTSIRYNGVPVDPFPLFWWPTPNGALVAWAQARLDAHSHDPGPADGIEGRRTRSAIAAFQAARAPWVECTRALDPVTIAALRTKPRRP